MNRINPRRRPATQADVNRAKRDAMQYATTSCYAVFLTVMKDKEGVENEDLKRIFDEINYLADSISKGYVTIEELRETLLEESGIEIK